METQTHSIHNFKPGELFANRYRLLRRAGSGGFADVWQAEDTEVGDSILALKIYARIDDDGKRELASEYRMLRDINHPNLLRSEHFGSEGSIFYLEMRYCDGGNLSGKAGKMAGTELRHVVRDICSGLAYLHQEGIVHQDIKPENILYDTPHRRYLLSDFGISSKTRSQMSKSVKMAEETISMTSAYAPPEKFSTNPADRTPDIKGDMFSLGVTLYELAIGVLPVDLPQSIGQLMLISEGRQPLYFDNIDDPLLRTIVQRCMSYHKEERPTAIEVLTLLDGTKTESDIGTKLETDSGKPKTEKIRMNGDSLRKTESPTPSPSPKPNRKWIYIAVVVVVAVLVGLALSRNHNSDTDEIDPLEEDAVPEEYGEYEEAAHPVRMDGNTIVCTVDGTEYRYRMVYVSGGSYTMGCTGEQGDDCFTYERPAHSVTVSGFYMGQTEVTQALWKAVMGDNPSKWQGNTLPVEQVSYNDCLEFIRNLNSLTGKTFRLPTEEEWEYAARGGNSSRGYKYSGSDNIGSVAWYDGNSDETHPVAQNQANELGLYDMSGNVQEWCSSLWCSDYSCSRSGSDRVFCGGGWFTDARFCRVSNRNCQTPSIRGNGLGFRLAR